MASETILYTTLVADDEPIEELPAEIITYGYRLNRPGALSFNLALDHPKCRRSIVGPGRHEAVIERNKQVVWRGPVLTAREIDTKKQRLVAFGGEGLQAHTRRMFVTTDLEFEEGVDDLVQREGLGPRGHHEHGPAAFGHGGPGGMMM